MEQANGNSWPWHLHSQGNERVVSRVPFVAPDLAFVWLQRLLLSCDV